MERLDTMRRLEIGQWIVAHEASKYLVLVGRENGVRVLTEEVPDGPGIRHKAMNFGTAREARDYARHLFGTAEAGSR